MFRKLLKHDFKAVFRYWWLLLPAVPAVSIALGLAFRFFDTLGEEFVLVQLLLMLFMFFAIIALSVSTVVTPVLSLIRFYKHFYTDEGYLTFTLPVRRSSLFLSKIVNAMLFNIMYAALMTVSISVAILIAAPSDVISEIFRFVFEMLNPLGAWTVLYAFEALLAFLALNLFSTILLYFCVTVGALVVKKAKLVVGLLIYYGVNTALSTLTQILTSIVLPLTSVEILELLGGLSPHAILGAFALIVLIITAVVATLAFTLYSMTLGRLERGLNLA